MKQLITVVITLTIAFILTCRLSQGSNTFYNVQEEPLMTDSVSDADLDFPATAGALLTRHPYR